MRRISEFLLMGGVDLVTPPAALTPGKLLDVKNYESVERGLRRIDGYERVDNKPSPSGAYYYKVLFEDGVQTVAAGDILTITSGGVDYAAIALENGVIESGSVGGFDAAGYLILAGVTLDGAYEATTDTKPSSGTLKRDAADVCRIAGTWIRNGHATDALHDAAIQAEITRRRATITPVPESPVTAVFEHNGVIYAVGARNLYKAPTDGSGWVQIQGGLQLSLNDVQTNPEGLTITGGTSGANGLMVEWTKFSGQYESSEGAGDGNAYGRGAVINQAGTFLASEPITWEGGGARVSDLNGGITNNFGQAGFDAGRKFSIDVNQIKAGQNAIAKAYMCDASGTTLQFDLVNETLLYVFYGLDPQGNRNEPRHVVYHNNHLFAALAGGTLLVSELGEALRFESSGGAAEFNLQQEITALQPVVNGALVIFCQNKISILYGTSAADFQLVDFALDNGAMAYTVQQLGTPVFLDQRGIRSLAAAQEYGNFLRGSMSPQVEPYFQTRRADGVTPIGSLRVRAKDQYRLFWSDGSFMTMYIGREAPEITFGQLPIVPTCFWCGDINTDQERLLFGGSDGYVYEMDKGTSFDGAAIDSFARFVFSSMGSTANIKRWHQFEIEADVEDTVTLTHTTELSYGEPEEPDSSEGSITLYGQTKFWNTASWGEFDWSAPIVATGAGEIDGVGTNLSVIFSSSSATEKAHTLHSMRLHYSDRRAKRAV